MFIVLSKLLGGLFVDPVGLVLLFLTAGVICMFILRWRGVRSASRRRWLSLQNIQAALFICGFSLLLFFSSPFGAHALMRGLERQYPPSNDYGDASAVVFLGGATIGRVPPRIHIETNFNSNRVFHAVRVFRQSSAPYLVLTGGRSEIQGNDTIPEAYSMFEFLHDLFGIDSAEVIIEAKSRNTRENAVYTKMAMEEAGLGDDIILVTNAYHMPRSVGIFKNAGFSRVIPAPTGYFADEFISPKPLSWLPGAGNLFQSGIALKEYCGILVYRVMGWI